jgi:DNA-binding NtrC family response regulator
MTPDNVMFEYLLKRAAETALSAGVDNYDFRRASARALRRAALELEGGDRSAAARRIKVSRNKIMYGLTNE